ncbi:hypothetical protein ABZP36_028217 [Zizania latifolia]
MMDACKVSTGSRGSNRGVVQLSQVQNGRRHPQDRRLYDVEASKYGRAAELESLIVAFLDKIFECVADIVINRRCVEKKDARGVYGTADDSCSTAGAWTSPRATPRPSPRRTSRTSGRPASSWT